MTFHEVRSSNIAAVCYDAKKQRLVVEFLGGRVYEYLGVEKEIVEDLLAAPSVGAFFHREIKSKAVSSEGQKTGQKPYVFRELEDDEIEAVMKAKPPGAKAG